MDNDRDLAWERENELYNTYDRVGHNRPAGSPVYVPVPVDVRPLYDTCGCIFPCPDHKSPKQDARRDDAYWLSDDRYAARVQADGQEAHEGE